MKRNVMNKILKRELVEMRILRVTYYIDMLFKFMCLMMSYRLLAYIVHFAFTGKLLAYTYPWYKNGWTFQYDVTFLLLLGFFFRKMYLKRKLKKIENSISIDEIDKAIDEGNKKIQKIKANTFAIAEAIKEKQKHIDNLKLLISETDNMENEIIAIDNEEKYFEDQTKKSSQKKVLGFNGDGQNTKG